MKTVNHRNVRRQPRGQRGQSLIIAIIILGVLLIIGFAFAGLVSRNIRDAGVNQGRSAASELSQSGIALAHYQLVNSRQGADWRPERTLPDGITPAGFSRDPDAVYLRQASLLTIVPDPSRPGEVLTDLGGPDFKGPYSRFFTERGRRLVRVRYAPNDVEGFARGNDSSLRLAGKARGQILIESIGRLGSLRVEGRVDPSKALPRAIQVANFVSPAEVIQAVAEGRQLDANQQVESRKMIAFAAIGLTENARFITNKFKRNEAAEIGTPLTPIAEAPGETAGFGVFYKGAPVDVPSTYGVSPGAAALGGRSTGWNVIPGGGSLYSNANIRVFGQNSLNLNTHLGDAWRVNGTIEPGSATASLAITRTTYDRNADLWQNVFAGNNTFTNPVVVSGAGLNSKNNAFSTIGQTLVDGSEGMDLDGQPRATPRLDPPSIMTVDPQSGLNRYIQDTRNTGRLVNGRTIGRFGYGQGVYVDASERANLDSEDERRTQGAVRSLPNDWLNPNNPNSVGWQGPYYIPVATYLNLLPDGFEIIRDSRSQRRLWRNADGSPSNSSVCRFRVRYVEFPVGSGVQQPFILNSIQHPNLVNAPAGSVTDDDFRNNGEPFNGVLYFEGDVRTRGVIATDVQLTVVSMGTIYVEGSITKGLVNVTNSLPAAGFGSLLTRPSRSMIMLMARDYVTVNTTMFFGPAPGQSPAAKTTDIVPDTPNPMELDWTESPEVALMAQFLVAPDANGGSSTVNPSTWQPYATNYVSPDGVNLPPRVLFSSSADDNGPSFVGMDVRPLTYQDPTSPNYRAYPFARTIDVGTGPFVFNAGDPFFPAGPAIPIYGLGDPAINAYPKFESIGFPTLDPATANVVGRRIQPSGVPGVFELALQDPTLFRLRLAAAGTSASKNFLVARTAIAPNDIRIEAAMFAEEGSFFVIPGSWFNTNPEDTRARFDADALALGAPQANLRRFQTYGSSPETPFYAEPLGVRITFVGALSENMPAPMSQQAEWKKKWGWIPNEIGASGVRPPVQHYPGGATSPFLTRNALPNLLFVYDRSLSLGSADGFNPVRRDVNGWVLPPLPRLPVSPTLIYFGDSNP